MENPLMMIVHALIIGVVLYLIMMYGLKQSKTVAMNRSILIAAVVLIYMILFGHGLPTKLNSGIF